MFTGIIEHWGRIVSLDRGETGGRLRVGFAAKGMAAGLHIGASIAVNGCCLTAVELGDDFFSADLTAETLARTSFGEIAAGRIVNLELPLCVGDRLGGHFVEGHVDGVGRVETMRPEGANYWLSVRIPQNLRRYVAEKGSLATDGISLTVARWKEGITEFAIIPHTFGNTNLREIAIGDGVNLECDILAKYVESLLEARGESIPERLSIEKLVGQGF